MLLTPDTLRYANPQDPTPELPQKAGNLELELQVPEDRATFRAVPSENLETCELIKLQSAAIIVYLDCLHKDRGQDTPEQIPCDRGFQ